MLGGAFEQEGAGKKAKKKVGGGVGGGERVFQRFRLTYNMIRAADDGLFSFTICHGRVNNNEWASSSSVLVRLLQ